MRQQKSQSAHRNTIVGLFSVTDTQILDRTHAPTTTDQMCVKWAKSDLAWAKSDLAQAKSDLAHLTHI
jgi:hypothetical protein